MKCALVTDPGGVLLRPVVLVRFLALTAVAFTSASVMDAILEGYPKPKKDFIEDVGIETDEDVGAKMPDY